MKKLACIICLFWTYQSIAQNFNFDVFKVVQNGLDSTLDWKYGTDSDGKLLWEMHADGEELHYEYSDSLIISAKQCFKRDSCFMYRYLYEDGREILKYMVEKPAFFDTIPFKITWRTEYHDTLSKTCYFEQSGYEPLDEKMHYRIKKLEAGLEEQTGFDEEGKAFYVATRKMDVFGPVVINIRFINTDQNHHSDVVLRRYPSKQYE